MERPDQHGQARTEVNRMLETGNAKMSGIGMRKPTAVGRSPSWCSCRRRLHLRPGRSLVTLLVTLAAIAFVVVPIGIREVPREIARWYRAAAAESSLNNDHASAVAQMDHAIQWDPEDPISYLVRASFKLENRQWQSGLDDCDRARKLDPDLEQVGSIRSQLLQHLGRHEAAIAEYQALLRRSGEASPGERASLLNALAYARAVGNRELRQAMEAADESLQIVTIPSALLDPAGYLCYARGYTVGEQGDDDLALQYLNEAYEHAHQAYERSVDAADSLDMMPRGRQEYEEQVNALKPHLLGILTLRANLFDKLEQTENAAQDRKRAKALGQKGTTVTSSRSTSRTRSCESRKSGIISTHAGSCTSD